MKLESPPQRPIEPLESRLERSRQAWRCLGMSIRSITPRSIGRAVLVFGALAGMAWLAVASWPALLPFIVGGVLAYIVSPLVDLLDHVLPRFIAALVGVLLLLAGIGALLWAVVPPLATQTVALIQQIPPETTLKDLGDQLILRIQFLPPSTREAVANAITTSTTRMQQNIRSFIPLLFTSTAILRFVSAIGFILGLIVLPTWVLTVLKEKPRARRSLGSMLPVGMQADFWAVLRILDRSFGTFFRGQVLVSLAVGLATYLGLQLLTRVGAPNSPYLVTFAVLAGLFQLIPEIGPLINIVLVTAVAYRIDTMLALYVFGLYLLIQYMVTKLVKDRIEQRIIDVNPALLVLVIVALGQLGFFWLFLAAPVAGATRDLFRYTYGRFSEPPRPAGLLPDEPLPAAASSAVRPVAPPQRRTPVVYRHLQAKPGQRGAVAASQTAADLNEQ